MPSPPTPSPSSTLSSPTVVTPDDLMDPRSPPACPESDSFLLSGDDTGKIQVFLRDRGCWESMYDPFESSPQPDDFSWEGTGPADDLSRCSLLIHEVSLLVGLAPDDVYPSSYDACPLVPDRPKQVPDILPLTLTPTKSLTSRKPTPAALARSTGTTAQGHSSIVPILPTIIPHPDDPTQTRLIGKSLSDPATPTLRHKNADSASPCRRQGQIFHLEQSFSDAPHRNAVYLDEAFVHPREPPPKPTLDPPANRCSSLDRLERSLLKLEAHAPRNRGKSVSQERLPRHVTRQGDKRPSLPPPWCLEKGPSSKRIAPRDASRPAHGQHPSDPPPVPISMSVHQHIMPLISPRASFNEDFTPGSFMDMDIPCAAEASQKRQGAFRQLASKGKVKNLLRAAKTASREIITWGKSLTESTKPPITG